MVAADLGEAERTDLLDRLTVKEREVLDLVLQHRTTKEIARDLDIAPNTVDMRLRTARTKLRAGDRNDVARAYRHLLDTCGKTTCGPAVMSPHLFPPLPASSEPTPRSEFVLRDAASFELPAPWLGQARTGFPEVLDERFGRWWRVVAIPLVALIIALLVLVLVAIAQALGMLI